ncbi:MAG: acyltransferase, partial [Chthoniobacterales bacterium]
MSNVNAERRVEGDWWPHPVPPNVHFGTGFFCESSQVFRQFKSEQPRALVVGDHVSIYAGCSFPLGPNATCSLGDFTLVNGALLMAEERIEIGAHCLISWNVGIADCDFHPLDAALRRRDTLALAPFFEGRPPRPKLRSAPVVIGDNVWIGMNATILKGVTIGENSVVA